MAGWLGVMESHVRMVEPAMPLQIGIGDGLS